MNMRMSSSPPRESVFHMNDAPQFEQDNLTQFLSPRKSKKKQAAQEGESSEKLFTWEEVKEIVARALAERESVLRQEYDKILQEQLQEQFRNFAKFNEDYISRQLKQSDFSYLS